MKPDRLPSGKWRARWRDHAGKWCSKAEPTEAAAKAAVRNGEVEAAAIRNGLKPAPKAQVPTFGAFVTDRWRPTYPASVGNRETTIRQKDYHIENFLVPELGHVILTGVRGEVVDRLFAKLRAPAPDGAGLGAKSIKNIRGTLRRVLQSAKDWGVIDAVPDLPRVKVPEPEFDFLTAEEARLLLTTVAGDPERLALLMFPLQTGSRSGEQRAIEWGDIDFANMKVLFRRSMPAGTKKVGPTKSGKGRDVPLTRELAAALKAIRHLRGDLVFSQADGTPWSAHNLLERLWSSLRRAGLRKICLHDLRHSYASQLVMANVPLIRVQKLLGHASIAMTMRYAHLSPGGDDAVLAALTDRHQVVMGERAS